MTTVNETLGAFKGQNQRPDPNEQQREAHRNYLLRTLMELRAACAATSMAAQDVIWMIEHEFSSNVVNREAINERLPYAIGELQARTEFVRGKLQCAQDLLMNGARTRPSALTTCS